MTVVTLWSTPLKVQDAPEASISMWEILRGLAVTVSFLYSAIDTILFITNRCRLTDLHSRTVKREVLPKFGIGSTDEADRDLSGVTTPELLARSGGLGLRRSNVDTLGTVHGCDTVVNAMESAIDAIGAG